jgi:hypothetical protein
MTFSHLCRDLFLLSNLDLGTNGSPRGSRWEQRIADHFGGRCVPSAVFPGGCTVLGHFSLSGLNHQIDATLGCTNALVISEWKAHSGTLPKNELLRFKAVTDDYFMSIARSGPTLPIMRVLCATGAISTNLRVYAALHGILLIEPSRWPSAVLASDRRIWPGRDTGPGDCERGRIAWLSRPLQSTLQSCPDGSFIIPKPPSEAMIEAALLAHDRWSERLWESIDMTPGAFESYLAGVWPLQSAS